MVVLLADAWDRYRTKSLELAIDAELVAATDERAFFEWHGGIAAVALVGELREEWRWKAERSFGATISCLADDLIVVQDQDVVRIDGGHGTEIGRFKTPGAALRLLTTGDVLVGVFESAPGRRELVALDGADARLGEILWSAPTVADSLVTAAGVVVGDEQGVLVAFDVLGGGRLWTVSHEGAAKLGATSDGGVVVVTKDGVQLIDAVSGAVRASREVSMPVAILGDRTLALEESPPTLTARLSSGETLWRTNLPAMPVLVAIGTDALFFVSERRNDETRALVRVEHSDGSISFVQQLELEVSEVPQHRFARIGFRHSLITPGPGFRGTEVRAGHRGELGRSSAFGAKAQLGGSDCVRASGR